MHYRPVLDSNVLVLLIAVRTGATEGEGARGDMSSRFPEAIAVGRKEWQRSLCACQQELVSATLRGS